MSDKDFAVQFAVLACEIAGADPSRAPLIERELRPPVTAGLRAGCTVREIARETGVESSVIDTLPYLC